VKHFNPRDFRASTSTFVRVVIHSRPFTMSSVVEAPAHLTKTEMLAWKEMSVDRRVIFLKEKEAVVAAEQIAKEHRAKQKELEEATKKEKKDKREREKEAKKAIRDRMTDEEKEAEAAAKKAKNAEKRAANKRKAASEAESPKEKRAKTEALPWDVAESLGLIGTYADVSDGQSFEYPKHAWTATVLSGAKLFDHKYTPSKTKDAELAYQMYASYKHLFKAWYESADQLVAALDFLNKKTGSSGLLHCYGTAAKLLLPHLKSHKIVTAQKEEGSKVPTYTFNADVTPEAWEVAVENAADTLDELDLDCRNWIMLSLAKQVEDGLVASPESPGKWTITQKQVRDDPAVAAAKMKGIFKAFSSFDAVVAYDPELLRLTHMVLEVASGLFKRLESSIDGAGEASATDEASVAGEVSEETEPEGDFEIKSRNVPEAAYAPEFGDILAPILDADEHVLALVSARSAV